MKELLHKLNKLPKTHKTMLCIWALALAAFAAGHVLLVRPIARRVTDLKEEVDGKEHKLRKAGWPLEVEQLRTIASRKAQEQRRITRLKDEVVNRTTALFKDKIMRLYETWKHFEKQVSRLDYQQEFLRVEHKLTGKGIKLHENILNLSEDSAGRNTYELMLQLWAFEAATDKLLAYDLHPVLTRAFQPDPKEDGEERVRPIPKASTITVLPPVPYYLHESDTAPYLLEFGVQFKVRGKTVDLHDFLAHASAPPNFIAVPRLEAQKPVPVGKRNNSDEVIEANIICTTYYLLNKEVRPAPRKAKPKALPAGA